MSTGSISRWIRTRLRRARRRGALGIVTCAIIVAGAIAFDITLSLKLVESQPGDSATYDQLAVNIVLEGAFSTKTEAPFDPTIIRTPGYPIFLAGVYEIAGIRNETAVRVTQAFFYLLACWMAGLIAFYWMPNRRRAAAAGWIAFTLLAFCPFTASFSGALLTETMAMFFLSAMTLSATYAIKSRTRWRSAGWWAASGLLAGTSVFFRPDAGLFALGLGLTIVFSVFFGRRPFGSRIADRIIKGLVFSALFILPLVPWTIRNERVFGVFQPLSPTHAEMPGEFVPTGYYRWLRTWIDDARYIDPLIWRLEIHSLKIDDVPAYAFSSEEEKQRIAGLFERYNNSDPDHPMPKTKPPSNDADKANCSDDSSDADDKGSDDSGDAASADDKGSGDDNSADNNSDDDQSSDDDEELNLVITPDVDAEFAQIADARIAADPMKYYVSLPLTRSTSMWFDCHSDFWPFTGELFPLDKLDENISQQIWLPLFALFDLLYTFLAFAGLLLLALSRRSRSWLWLFLVLAISIPRILFFGTLENPEPRYLIEMFIPASILGGMFLASFALLRRRGRAAIEFRYR